MSAKKDLRFDPRELDAMQDPITVRVEKVRGSMRTPIDLPPREPDLAPGVGWDKDSIRRLETWLVNEWSGGGFYNFTITDSGGRRMEWQSVYPPAEFPERVPPTMQNATSAAAAAKAPQPHPMGGGGNGMWPPPGFSYAPQAQAQPQYAYPQGYGQGPQQGYGQGPAQQPMQIFLPSMPSTNPQPWGSWAPPPPTTATSPFAAAAPPTPSPPTPASPFIRGNGQFNGNGHFNGHFNGDEFGRGRRRFSDEDEKNEKNENEKKELERRTKEMEERLRVAERQQLEAHHQRELEKAQLQAHRDLEKAQQLAHQQLEQMRLAATQAQAQAQNPEVEQLREARQQIERERERNERDQRERSERERVDRQFVEMISMIKGIAETKPVATGPDPIVLTLQEQQKTLQEELRRERDRAQREQTDRDREERIRREAEAREEKLRHEQEVREERGRREAEAVKEEIRRRDEENRRREELLQQQLLEIKNNANRGPDPMLMMMQESTKSQLETMRAMMQGTAQNADRMQSFMMATMQKDDRGGFADLQRNIVDVYKDVFDMQRELMAQAAQLQTGGESPTMRILEEGIKRASGLADRYLNVKKVEAIGQAKVQEASMTARAVHEQAQMQASHAWNVQQAQLAELARREAAQAQAQAGGLNGTNGHVAQPAQPPKKRTKKTASEPAPAPGVGTGTVGTGGGTETENAQIAKVIPLRRHGRTDEEWFGPAFPHVKQLREAVTEYIKSLSSDPPRVDSKTGEVVGASAEQSVEFLMRAVNYVMARNQAEQVPAISELFLEDRFPELLDILIPDAPQAYRDHCVQIILAIAKQMQAENELPDVEDEDDEDEEEDEDEE